MTNFIKINRALVVKKQKLFTLFLALAASVGIIFADSGTCGENLTWDLTDSVLTISGTGTMNNYTGSDCPWHNYCSFIKSAIIKNGVTSIGDCAFCECVDLTSVAIPNSVTSIGQFAFYGCSGLTSVTIPNSVTSIGGAAFYGCTGLTSVTIPNSVTNIGARAFVECSSLTAVTIPNSVTSLGVYAFSSGKLTSIDVASDNPNYCSVDGVLFNKDKTELIQYPIGNARTEYTIPNSVTSIGGGAFEGCSSLTSITIPSSVTSIGNYAFMECSSLTSVTIGNSVTSIGSGAFGSCTSLTSVTIPNSVTSIGSYAFAGCTGLTSITIPNSVTSIGNSAFNNVPNIVYNGTAIGSPWGARCINGFVEEWCVYSDNTKTTLLACSSAATGEISIPNSVTSIGGSAFYGCSSLTSVTIPNSVTSIGESAFEGCTSLTSITLGNGITRIGEKVFEGCNNIQTVVWKLKTYSDFTSSTKPFSAPVTSFTFSEDVEYIPAYLCYNMNELESVSIGENVSGIGKSAFFGCDAIKTIVWNAKNVPDFTSSNKPFSSSITSITFGEIVEHIPAYLCYGLGKQLAVTINAVTPPTIGNNVFSSRPAHIYVPCGSIETYKAATNWSTYASAIKYEPLPFTITITPSYAGEVIKPTTICEEMMLTANPSNGYAFAQWSDGNTDNPRTIELTQDTSFTALFAAAKSGTCGDDMALTWEYNDENKTLIISGNGALNSNYTYGLEAPQNMTRLVLDEGITSIGQNAFYNCSSLKSVVISNSVTSIGGSAFSNCNIKEIHFTGTVEEWLNKTWYSSSISTSYSLYIQNDKITDFSIPDNVTTIGNGAFSGCSSLTSITIPNSVTSIGEQVFCYCSSLTSVTIPNSVTNIGKHAFLECYSLTSIDVAADNPQYHSVNGVLFNREMTLLIQYPGGKEGAYSIPNSVTSIGDEAFYKCSNLTSIEIPNSVTSIGGGAFSYCTGLTSVTIPNSVIYIGEEAFSCNSLTSVYNYGENPAELGTRAFNSTTLYVLANSLDVYKSSDWAKCFLYVKPIGAESISTTTLQIIPSDYSATVIWASISGAYTYELVIRDKKGNVICTLIFNAQGQLTSIAFNAPGRNMPQQTQAAGFSFTVTGLEQGMAYDLTVTAKDQDGNVIDKKDLSFNTDSPEAVEQFQSDNVRSIKYIREGQIFILRGDKIYTATGAEVK